ncbi:hypothetical protein Tco_0608344 [Tanacetum coccineum]
MFLNLDQLEKQLDKEEFQEIRYMVAFRVLETQFQKFIKSWFSLDDDDSLMTHKYFLAYTQTEVQQFQDSLIQYMESIKKSIDERALYIREYDSRANERQMQPKEGKQDTSSSSWNDADIKPVYDEEPMVKVPSYKTTNRNKLIEQLSIAKKPERQIPTGHRFSTNMTSIVHEKIRTPRSCLRWKPTGRIFKTVGLRWVPTGKIFTSSTTKVDNEPPHGSNEDITNEVFKHLDDILEEIHETWRP